MAFGIVLDVLYVLVAVLGLVLGFKRGITHTVLVKRRKLTALIFGTLLSKPIARLITNKLLLAPFTRFVMKTAGVTDTTGATSAEELLDNVPLVIRYVADRFDYDLKAVAESAYAKGQGMYYSIISDLSYPLVNFISLILCSLFLFFVLRLILRLLSVVGEGVVQIPLIKQINFIAGGLFGLLFNLALLWVLSKVFLLLLTFEKFSSLSFLSGFEVSKTYVFRYIAEFNPLTFILSIK